MPTHDLTLFGGDQIRCKICGRIWDKDEQDSIDSTPCHESNEKTFFIQQVCQMLKSSLVEIPFMNTLYVHKRSLLLISMKTIVQVLSELSIITENVSYKKISDYLNTVINTYITYINKNKVNKYIDVEFDETFHNNIYSLVNNILLITHDKNIHSSILNDNINKISEAFGFIMNKDI